MTAVLVGDVGGTHARFAIVEPSDTSAWEIRASQDLRSDEFASLFDAVRAYVGQTDSPLPPVIAIGVAGPVVNGSVSFTNLGWRASEAELKELGFDRALLINDFAALAFAVPMLSRMDWRGIGPDLVADPDAPISILGAGTGFGLSCLARFRNRSIPMATEGGHAGFAPGSDVERDILRLLAGRFGHVSIERVLSGAGLENIFHAMNEIAGHIEDRLSAPEIVARATDDRACRDAVEVFCGIFGSVAGDFALAHGARGGVYIAGGIAQKIEHMLAASQFRVRFEDKGRLSYFVKAIPTRLVLHEDAAFLGAARAGIEFGR